jgi:hypothetical protein
LSRYTSLGYNAPIHFPAFIPLPLFNPATIPIIPVFKASPWKMTT